MESTTTFELHPDLQGISHRSTLPLILAPPKHGRTLPPPPYPKIPVPDPSNVQGDIFLRFPKIYQTFIFFIITNVPAFKTALKSYTPTSSANVSDALLDISKAKLSGASGQDVDVMSTQIAFSRLGLDKLGIVDKVRDKRFDQGPMRIDKTILGDMRDWDKVFDDKVIHGIIMVCAKTKDTCQKGVFSINKLFAPSVTIKDTFNANVRPPPYKGKEHFGYQDGLAQPVLRGLASGHPGQTHVDPGVIIMGYNGDPVFDDPDPNAPKRPAWTKDGSIMVFRKLEQDVPGFNGYLEKYGPRWTEFTPVPDEAKPPLSPKEGADFFGARIIGRWKSGTPLPMAHFRDDPKIGSNPDKTNDFDYSVPGIREPSDRYCPFTAHTRKTAPRNLDPYIARKFFESAAIVRAGIPYGPEVSVAPDAKRGLMFVCYQSSTEQGFFLQTTGFANNAFFPITGLVPQKHGQDPVLGGPEAPVGVKGTADITSEGQVILRVTAGGGIKDAPKIYEVSGFAKEFDQSAAAWEPEYWVTSRGGEYFFVPSLSVLKSWAA